CALSARACLARSIRAIHVRTSQLARLESMTGVACLQGLLALPGLRACQPRPMPGDTLVESLGISGAGALDTANGDGRVVVHRVPYSISTPRQFRDRENRDALEIGAARGRQTHARGSTNSTVIITRCLQPHVPHLTKRTS